MNAPRKLPIFADQILKAIPVALKAGKEIMKIYHSQDFGVEKKEDNSPLTLADKASHDIINDALSLGPYPVLSEEGKSIPFEKRNKWDTLWIVDPLDGTKEFVKQNGEFTVNIALVNDHLTEGGIVYAPVKDQLYLGLGPGFAFRVDQASKFDDDYWETGFWLRYSEDIPFDCDRDHIAIVASRSHMTKDTQEFIDEVQSQFGDIELASRGSSLKLCMVAEGSADIYPRFAPTMEWDTAAGQAVAESAGMKVVDADSLERIIYNKEDLLNPWFIVHQPEMDVESVINNLSD